MFCSSSSTSTTHLRGTDVVAMHGDVETRALAEVRSVSAEQRSSTSGLRCGAATTSRVKGEESKDDTAGTTPLGSVRKTNKGGGSAPSAMERL